MPVLRSKAWYWTWHVDDDRIEESMEEMIHACETIVCTYIVVQCEMTPTTNKPHLQGYIVFKSAKDQPNAKRAFRSERISIRIPNGDAAQNTIYCSKIESRAVGQYAWCHVRGTMPNQGRRADIVAMKDDIKAGLSDLEMFDKYPYGWHQYRRTLMEYRANLLVYKFEFPVVTVLWGETGTGKSHQAYMRSLGCDGKTGYVMACAKGEKQWFDGCIGSVNIVLEDFDGGMPYRLFLRVLDKYPLRVDTKGGSGIWSPERIFITSNVKPEEWYDQKYWGALKRRLFKCHEESSVEELTEVYEDDLELPE